MKTFFPLLIAAAGLAAAGGAAAQNLKPGLWQIQQQTHSASGQMESGMAQAQQQMANLPPEQRKMAEQMMASRGIKMGPGGPGGGMSVQVCMTPEMVQRNEVPTQQRGDCTSTRQPASGRTMKFSFSCTRPPSRGEGEVSFDSPEAYSSRTVVHTQMQGRDETLTMESSGKWLAADCGSVKPLRPPAPPAR